MKCGMCSREISLHPARKCRVSGCPSKKHKVPHVHCYPYNYTYCELDFGKEDIVRICMDCVYKIIGTDKIKSYKWLHKEANRSVNSLLRKMLKILDDETKSLEILKKG
jgi:hypothetical protein